MAVRRNVEARLGMWRGAGRAALFAAAAIAITPAWSASAPFEDTTAQRVLACTGCHGREGRAAADGYYPRIAGKPVGYLFNQLRNFRDGRRHYELMSGLLAPLGDDYLREIASHFASLDLPYAQPLPATETAVVRAAGEALVTQGDAARGLPACTSCHGAAMTGRAPFIPGLLGLPRDYLNGQLGAWKNGKRHAQEPDCMATVAERLTPADIGAVSAWLAAQTVPTLAKPALGAAGAKLPLTCGSVVDAPLPDPLAVSSGASAAAVRR